MTPSARKIAVITAAIAARTYLPFLLIGLWNRLFGGWRSIFFCYAGGPKYKEAYAGQSYARFLNWHPTPIGILRQGGHRGLVLACPMTEADFRAPENAENFRKLRRRIRRAAALMGGVQIHMAGILPSILSQETDLPLFPSRDITVEIVVRATTEMRRRAFRGQDVPVILLGGAGFIGREVTRRLDELGWHTHVVDTAIGVHDLPAPLRGRPALLVDLARPGALAGHLEALWPELAVLNEVFPEPNRHELAQYEARGITLWHLAGVTGRISPPLPGAYAGAVPCCATHDATADLSPVLRHLSGAPTPALPRETSPAPNEVEAEIAQQETPLSAAE